MKKNILTKTGIVIICFVIFVSLFLPADYFLGIRYFKERDRIFHPYYHHGFKENAVEVSTWGSHKYVRFTNSLGLIDVENRSIAPQTEKHRILFIGDSFVEGIGYPYEMTFVGMIDDSLDKTKYEVLNAAASSYSPKLEYFKLKYLIEKKGIKINDLFVFIDVSDIQDEIAYSGFEPNKTSMWGGNMLSILKSIIL